MLQYEFESFFSISLTIYLYLLVVNFFFFEPSFEVILVTSSGFDNAIFHY